MEKITTSSQHNFSLLNKNLQTVQTYLIDRYKENKKGIAEGLSFFKEELSGTLERTGRYINHAALPVNNFLKDIAQIEKELMEELRKSQEYSLCLDGKMVPASEVLSLPMEENY